MSFSRSRLQPPLLLLLLWVEVGALGPSVVWARQASPPSGRVLAFALIGRTSGAVLDRSLRVKAALAGELDRSSARRRRRLPEGGEAELQEAPSRAEPLLSPAAAAFAARLAPTARVIGPAAAIKGLYAAFNARDAEAAASFLSEDCVYEDLLLGPYTVCRGKRAFSNALRFHPAFLSSQLFSGLPLADRLPTLELVVDSVAEGASAVGVEWHVEIGGGDFPLGRGLTQASRAAQSYVCMETTAQATATSTCRVASVGVMPHGRRCRNLNALVEVEEQQNKTQNEQYPRPNGTGSR